MRLFSQVKKSFQLGCQLLNLPRHLITSYAGPIFMVWLVASAEAFQFTAVAPPKEARRLSKKEIAQERIGPFVKSFVDPYCQKKLDETLDCHDLEEEPPIDLRSYEYYLMESGKDDKRRPVYEHLKKLCQAGHIPLGTGDSDSTANRVVVCNFRIKEDTVKMTTVDGEVFTVPMRDILTEAQIIELNGFICDMSVKRGIPEDDEMDNQDDDEYDASPKKHF